MEAPQTYGLHLIIVWLVIDRDGVCHRSLPSFTAHFEASLQMQSLIGCAFAMAR